MSDDRSYQRLRAVMTAVAEHLGRGWTTREDADVPSLGLGRSDPFRRVAAFCERRPVVGARAVIRRGIVIWREVQRFRQWYGDGETVSIRWRWEVDDGDGFVAHGEAPSLPKAVDGFWRDLWRATVDPVDHVAELLRQRGDDFEAMGAPHVSEGRVRWGYTLADQRTPAPWLNRFNHPLSIIVDPDVEPIVEGWPAVVHHGARPGSLVRLRMVRVQLPPADLAVRLASIAMDYARQGLDRDLGEPPTFPSAASGEYVTAPPVPAAVAGAASAIGSMVDDWKARLRTTLAGETPRQFKARKKRMAERAELRLRLPGSGMDEYGRSLSWSGRAEGPARLAVPVDLLGALWALGLGLRDLSAVTTGRPSSRNTVNQRIGEMREGADGWTESATGAQLVERRGLGWARDIAGGALPGSTARGPKRKRPAPAAGGASRTPEPAARPTPEPGAPARTFRVRRRNSAPLIDVLTQGQDPDDDKTLDIEEAANVSKPTKRRRTKRTTWPERMSDALTELGVPFIDVGISRDGLHVRGRPATKWYATVRRTEDREFPIEGSGPIEREERGFAWVRFHPLGWHGKAECIKGGAGVTERAAALIADWHADWRAKTGEIGWYR